MHYRSTRSIKRSGDLFLVALRATRQKPARMRWLLNIDKKGFGENLAAAGEAHESSPQRNCAMRQIPDPLQGFFGGFKKPTPRARYRKLISSNKPSTAFPLSRCGKKIPRLTDPRCEKTTSSINIIKPKPRLCACNAHIWGFCVGMDSRNAELLAVSQHRCLRRVPP